MVHLFFARIVKRPQAVDNWFSEPSSEKFTTVYEHLFPSEGWYSRNVVTYLNAISNFFHYDQEMEISRGIRNKVSDFFESLGLDSDDDENLHVFNFWVYLVKLYNSGYDRNDNYFRFMEGFSFYDTKVVIVGQDPSNDYESSGYAFHGSPCPSTKIIYDLLNDEMRRVERVVSGGVGGGVALTNRRLDELKDSSTFLSWINQNVLLVNSWLSPGGNLWDSFTNFLVGALSKLLKNVVFILVGKTARDKKKFIDCERHCVIPVLHPSHLLRRYQVPQNMAHLEWDRVMPFVNANFYWYQLDRLNCMVDWTNFVRGGRPSPKWNATHLRQYEKLFELAIQAKEEKDEETGSDVDAYVYLPHSNQEALVVRRCQNGLLVIRKSYKWD